MSIKKIKISSKEQIFFSKRLAFMIKAGLPLSESLGIMQKQKSSKRFTSLLTNLYTESQHGTALHTSLSTACSSLTLSSLHLIKVGEENGLLADNLEFLSEDLKKRRVLQQKIISALIYPCCIGLGTFALAGFLTFYIFPKIRPLFLSMNLKLPLSTRLLISVSTFFEKNWLASLLSLVLGICATSLFLKKNRYIKYKKDQFLINTPAVRYVVINYFLAVITRDIGIKLKAGIPLQDAVDPSVSSNTVYKKTLEYAKNSLNSGEKLSAALSQSPRLYPDILVQMITTAELTGTLPETLIYLSDFHEREVDDFSKNLSSILEPLMMIGMGIIVGFISLSILLPIYELSQNIKH